MHRQRGEIRQLQRAGISTVSAEALLERMLNKIDQLCAERDPLKSEQGPPRRPELVMPHQPLRRFDEREDHPPWIKALAEVRQRAAREGCCYHHVQAIIVAIDQYAEAALGNRDFFLNMPYGIGGGRRADIP